MAGLLLKNVGKEYAGNLVVQNFNLEIYDKEFLVLVGPSGCGKSTTLRMVAGLEEITFGEIHLGDQLVNDVPAKDRDVAMVFQSYALYPHMNAYDNMAFGLKMRHFPRQEIDRRVREAARILDITHLLDRKPKALSGGQRQRVALGRAIVREPKVFLMDEPLSNLDAKLRVQMRTEISKLCRRLETTVIYVTHDQTEAMTMGDRIVVMKDGLIQQVDTPINLYQCPTNMFVAGFIGSPAMNFVKARVEADDEATVLVHPAFRLPVPAESAPHLNPYRGKELVVGIRPEALSDNSHFLAEYPDWSTEITVDSVEAMGVTSLVYFALGEDAMVAQLPGNTRAKLGQKHKLALDMSCVCYFDPETTARIC